MISKNKASDGLHRFVTVAAGSLFITVYQYAQFLQRAKIPIDLANAGGQLFIIGISGASRNSTLRDLSSPRSLQYQR
jgi:hypothetical protein